MAGPAIQVIPTKIDFASLSSSSPPPPPAARSLFTGKEVNIAVLLPLSGSSSGLGKELLNTIQLALYDTAPANVRILPFDTKGTALGAIDAINDAAQKDVKLVIGPLFSHTTKAVVPITQSYNINVLSFSNDQSLLNLNAEDGAAVFLLGMMPDEQVHRIINYATRQGITEFAILVPSNSYGTIALEAYKEALELYGGINVRTEFYNDQHSTPQTRHSRKQFRRSVYAVVNSLKNYIPPEILEAQELEASLDEQTELSELSFGKEEYIPGIRGLLVPEGGKILEDISRIVHKHGNANIQLLGSRQWDNPSFYHNPLLKYSWFTSTETGYQEYFQERFSQIFGRPPHPLSSLAYDAIALASTLTQVRSQDFEGEGKKISRYTLTNPNGFAGVEGTFRFWHNGYSERNLAVVTVENNEKRVLEPAPERFF